MQQSQKVVVIGGGYGGLRFIERMVGLDGVKITLIDKQSYHYLQTEAYGYIAGRFDLHDVALDLENWSHGFEHPVEFIHDEARFIDYDKRVVQLTNSSIPYDYLVIATGAQTHFFSFIPGLKEQSFGVKELKRSFDLRNAFESLLYAKVTHEKVDDENNLNIVIGGAGLSGVEIAAEMAYVVHTHAQSIGKGAKDIKIYLVDAGETILPGQSDYIIRHTMNRLRALDVEIMTGAFIERIEDHHIYFKGGDALKYRHLVFTGGITANRVDSSCEEPLVEMQQYQVDSYLQLHEGVFAIGDCTAIYDKAGRVLPPTAQIAEKSAEYVAAAVKKGMKGEPLKKFSTKMDGIFVALGGHYAVGELFGWIKVKGKIAFALKKYITKSYYLGLKLRLNTGFKKRTATHE